MIVFICSSCSFIYERHVKHISKHPQNLRNVSKHSQKHKHIPKKKNKENKTEEQSNLACLHMQPSPIQNPKPRTTLQLHYTTPKYVTNLEKQ